MTDDGRLDPRTAFVSFTYDLIGDPDGDYNIDRSYYWYDPNGVCASVSDGDFRREHAEIADEWDRLFYEAFDRGQKAFEQEVLRTWPGFADTDEGRLALGLGRILGPRPPQNEAPA